MNGFDLKKFIHTSQDKLEGYYKYIKILKLSAVLSALSRVHVPTILNFAPSLKELLLTAGYKTRKPTLISEWGNCKNEGPEAVIARLCVKARRMGYIVSFAAESGEDWRSPRSSRNC